MQLSPPWASVGGAPGVLSVLGAWGALGLCCGECAGQRLSLGCRSLICLGQNNSVSDDLLWGFNLGGFFWGEGEALCHLHKKSP